MQPKWLFSILGTLLIVCLAYIVGEPMLEQYTAQKEREANRAAVIGDLQKMAERAHRYYQRPVVLGGGGESFVGLTDNAWGILRLVDQRGNENGVCYVTVPGDRNHVVVLGTGNRGAEDGARYVTYEMHIFSDRPDSLVKIH
jgi:hypothetical protein